MEIAIFRKLAYKRFVAHTPSSQSPSQIAVQGLGIQKIYSDWSVAEQSLEPNQKDENEKHENETVRRSHFGRARENGVTQEELIETITHLAFYAGWPNAITAISVAREVFQQK